MLKYFFSVLALIVGVSSMSLTWAAEAPPKVDESTREADKASARQASTEADRWAATHKPEAPPVQPAAAPAAAAKPAEPPPASSPAATTTPAAASTPTPPVTAPVTAPVAEPPKAAPPPPVILSTKGLNEMHGKLQSKSYDPQTLRVIVDGGYNVEFSYDAKTILINGGNPVTIDDLNYGDELIIRYAGKDLNAVQVDRVSKAAH